MKNAPGAVTGALMGTLFLLGGIGMRIWAPNFSGFYDRGLSEPVLPVWVILLGLAVVNFIYAGLSVFIQRQTLPAENAGAEDDDQHRLQSR